MNSAGGVDLRRAVDQPAMAAILIRLWARTPCPAPIRAPSRSSRRVRSHPYCRLRVLIRASLPVRHLTVRRNARRCSWAWRAFAGSALAWDHHCADPEAVQVVLHGGFAVAAVGGDPPTRASSAKSSNAARRACGAWSYARPEMMTSTGWSSVSSGRNGSAPICATIAVESARCCGDGRSPRTSGRSSRP